jgi:hypothetical protein
MVMHSPTAPHTPTDFTVLSTTFTTAELSWTAPYDGGSPITGYEITYSFDGENWVQSIIGGTLNTFHLVTGLMPSTYYGFIVKANNLYGAGGWTVVYASTTTATVPIPPTDFTVLTTTSTSVTFSWLAPLNNGGSEITGYEILRDQNNHNW